MPLPMVHLSIAHKMFQQRGMEPNGAFLLGSIAPDAIHMREHAVREDKHKTHFYLQETGDIEEFINNKIAPFIESFPSSGDASWFAKGYAAHVLTDLLWLHSIFSDFRKKIEQDHVDDHRTLYYQETDQVDFNFFNKEAWRPSVWSLLEQTSATDVTGLLTAEEVDQWKQRTLKWFIELSKEPQIEPKYITEANVRGFIDQTVGKLLSLSAD